MIEDYTSLKCPRCASTVELARKGVRTNILLCPVCLEGEIEYQVRLPNIDEIIRLLPRRARSLRRRTPALVKS